MDAREHNLEEEYLSGSIPEVFRLVGIVWKKLKQMQRRTTQRANLTPPQYVVLGALWQEDERPLKDLAEICYCTPATITGIVDTLEGKGLVKRQANPTDRRSLLAALTEGGKALERSIPSMEKMFGNCCQGLDEDEARQLALLLKKLNDSLSF